MTTPNLDHLAALEAAATPGPWGECGESGEWWVSPMTVKGEYLPEFVMNSGPDDISQEDLDLIVALRNAAPALLATARSYEALLSAVTAVVDARNDADENAALADLATVYEALTGRSAASGEGYVKEASHVG